MLDINFIRNNIDSVRDKLLSRHDNSVDRLGDLFKYDNERKELSKKINDLNYQKNKLSDEIAKHRGSNTTIVTPLIEKSKQLSIEIKETTAKLKTTEDNISNILLYIPNIPHESVPIGKDSNDNIEVKRWQNGSYVYLRENVCLS